jgi:hypothetical protein
MGVAMSPSAEVRGDERPRSARDSNAPATKAARSAANNRVAAERKKRFKAVFPS